MRARAAPSPSGRPSTRPPPAVGCTSPGRIFTEVVFPAPLGPRKPKTVPGGTLRVRSRTAALAPYSFRSARVSRAGSLTDGGLADRLGHREDLHPVAPSLDAEDLVALGPEDHRAPATGGARPRLRTLVGGPHGAPRTAPFHTTARPPP